MFWVLYLALPVYAASHVAPKRGFLAGLGVLIAVMIAVLVPQTAFLLWLSAVVDRRSKANPEKGPARTTVESANVPMPEKTGARARFRQLIVYQIELNQVLSAYNREQQDNQVSDYLPSVY
jgi:hypothetical protein